MPTLVPLAAIAPGQVESLLDAAFGQDRHQRTAYLLRQSSKVIAPLSFALRERQQLIASIQCWPVNIAGQGLVLVGPVAVDPAQQNQGYGGQLMHAMLEAATELGDPAMVMIGDPEYYGRFGFSAEKTGGWILPGPWEPRRLLSRNISGVALPVSGKLERADAL